MTASAYHPWNDAGSRLSEWVIRRCTLDGLHEVMCWDRKVILLEANRTKWERRTDLAHAIAHIDLGHRELSDKNEEAACRLAAKKLIDIEPLGDALVWNGWQANWDTATDLGVDYETLCRRLTHLHPAERAHLIRRRDAMEIAA